MQVTWAHKGVSIAALIAMLVQGPAVASKSPPREPAGRQGLCRQPAALPQLGPENWDQQQQQRPGGTPSKRMSKTAGGGAPPGAMEDTSEMVVTGTAMPAPAAVEAPSAPPPPPPPPLSAPPPSEGAAPADARVEGAPGGIMPHPMPPRPQPYPQAGILTAGEHDDLLNPELYALYQRRSNLGQEVRDVPRLDTARVLTVSVKDRQGRPVPFAPVDVACSDGGSLRLATTADGTVSLFPDVDRLGRNVRLRTAGAEWRSVAIASDAGGQRVDFTVARAAQAVTKLDLMLVIDTTGSMGDEIRYLQAELGSILGMIRSRHPGVDIRVGFVFYKDIGDNYVTRTVPLTRDFARAQGELAQHFAGGGGDYPEAMDQAMIRAAGQQWRPDAVKSLMLVADAPPHDENIGLTWRASEVLRHQRVQIVPVAASGVADKAEYVMRAMAALTQSRYTFLTDDSGVGNPHAAPAIDCYLVTRLNSLLVRVIDSQLSGRRIEPADQEVIRTVGNYDHGKCVLPPGGLQDQ